MVYLLNSTAFLNLFSHKVVFFDPYTYFSSCLIDYIY